jgi:NAD(P)-dependent dehydrogenase (short-subunit alcohol dehydrogenase family)
VPAAERHKTLRQAGELLDWLTGTQISRRDVIVLLGGGVVIDMGGFVASAYMRGVQYLNLPTSLIAQVDAGIGGISAEGAHVVGVDADPAYGGVVADVTDPDEIARAVLAAGELDICVANAGVSLMEPFLDGDMRSWERVLRVNLLGVMNTFQQAALAMPRGGRLLATASVAGLRGEPDASAYCASKAGVLGLVRALAVELAPRGLTVNAVAPGQIDTRMNSTDLETVSRREGRPAAELLQAHLDRRVPARRLGTPDEVAALFAFLASDAAFMTGTVVTIDGGELAG